VLDNSAFVIACGSWAFWYGSLKMCKNQTIVFS